MDYTKELKVLNIIKKHLMCEKHNQYDETLGFLLLKSLDKEEYELVKDYFEAKPREPKTYSPEDNFKEKSFYERNK